VRAATGLIGYVRKQTPEFAKFCVIGTVAFVISDGGSNLLFQAGLGPLTSNAVATIVATAFAFVGNRYWTFRRRQRSGVGREGVLFFVFNGIALLIQLACIAFSSYALGLTGKLAYTIALLLGIGLAMVFRFWSYRKWVWLAPPQAPDFRNIPTVTCRQNAADTIPICESSAGRARRAGCGETGQRGRRRSRGATGPT